MTLIDALQKNQEGQSTFSELLEDSWKAGRISYDMDFAKRIVTYFSCEGESSLEEYPTIKTTI